MASPAPLTLQPTQLPLGPSKSTSHLASFSSPHPPLPSPILSRKSSRVSFAPRPITTSKSASVLLSQPPNTTKKSQNPSPPTPLRPALKSSVSHTPTQGTTSIAGEEWWLQTASTLTLAAAESKGQAWLATRSSSTSLGHDDDDDAGQEDSYHTRSPENTRSSSTPHAQLSPSATRYPPPLSPYSASRRGSVQLNQSRSNSVTFSPLHHDPMDETFGRADVVQGPMFVDLENAEDERYIRRSYSEGGSDVDEEGEVRRLIKERVGGWVDYFVGWMDFRDEESGRVTDGEVDGRDEEQEEGSGYNGDEDLGRRKERRKMTLGKAGLHRRDGAKGKAREVEADSGEAVPTESEEGGGVWTDAKWFLGVASKVVL